MFDAHAADLGDREVYSGEGGPGSPSKVKLDLSHGLEIRRFDDIELVLVATRVAGFGSGRVDVLRKLVHDIASGQIGPCKFLVFDLCASSTEAGKPAPGFDAFVEDVSNLIFQAPVLSIAWARQYLSGPELELALACSMLVGEQGARFGFDVDLVDSLRTYALLAHKLGFVRAERLMEDGSVIGASAAHDLMLLHSVVPAGDGVEGIRSFAKSRLRRHNSSCGLYRAQRINMTGAR